MREIKFRAKTATTNSWVYGHYAFVDGYHVIYENGRPLIIRLNTLGQYTGLKDKNGKEIYEGDILAVGSEDYLMQVIWISESWGYEVIKNETNRGYIVGHKSRGGLCFYIDLVDVFGNIYENPELLKKGELK
ncbi:YopX family protein [Bacillus cereus]|uniref:YopX family protein n=1 Tax=Bacillus cereus TaxID=1396 RepID=UPI002853699B|nr:YopX family protein [Bacillus cereus]MDR4986176.1 YopX family protein [Bacillus cereus]